MRCKITKQLCKKTTAEKEKGKGKRLEWKRKTQHIWRKPKLKEPKQFFNFFWKYFMQIKKGGK